MIAGNRKGCFVISKHDEFVYGSCLIDAPNVETRFEIAMNIESMLKVKHLLKLTPSQEKIINVFKIPKKYFGKK